MSHAALRRVLPQLRRFLDAQSAPELTDGKLLERFVSRRDEAAFALLVERHGPMVLSICRRMLRDAHEAEDAFQAAFVVLALRAGSVRRRESLGSWLYGVARRVAAKARAQSARRRGREAPLSPAEYTAADAAPGRGEFRAVLEEEVGRLPEECRRPFVLCCLEEKTQEQAAAELGCPRSSLASRLTRARQALRRRLTERGLAPASLTAAAVRTACAAVRGSAPARVMALAGGAMKALSTTRILVILSLTLFAGAGVAAAILARPAPEGATAPAAAPAPKAADEPEAARTDRYGDPLPPGALMRLGTVRFRHGCNGLCDAVYSPDGKILATAGETGRIHLWDAATGKEIAALESEKNTILLSLAFSPDGKTLAAGGSGFDSAKHEVTRLPTKLTLWDLATRKPRLSFENEHDKFGNQHDFRCLAYSPDGKWLAAGCDESVRVWEVATAKELPPIKTPQISAILAFSPDSRTLAWGGNKDDDAVLWDVAADKEVRRLERHKSMARQFAFTADGKLLAVAYYDKTIGLWDPATGKEVRRLNGHEADVVSVAFSPDGKTLASAARNTEPVRLWDVASGEVRFRLQVSKAYNYVARVVFSPDGKTLAVAHRDGTVFLWDPATGKRLPAPDEHTFVIVGMDLSPDGQTLATAGGEDGTVRLWDLATGRRVRTLEAAGAVIRPSFSPDGGRVTAETLKGPPVVWETATGRELAAPPLAADAPALVLSSTVTGVAGPDGTFRLLETATGKELQTFKGVDQRLRGAELSPDGKTLAMLKFPERDARQFKEGPTVRLWNVATGQETYRIGDVNTLRVAFSPDSRTAAAAEPGRVRFWDVASGQELPDFRQPDIGSCRFSPDGRVLATFSSVGPGVRLWELSTGRERLRLAGHGDGTVCALFTPDGRTLITGGADSTALVWDLAPPEPEAKDLDHLWSDLADDDASRAYRAIWALAASPGVVDFLKARLKPASGAEAKEVRRLIADLDGDDFEKRERASADLGRMGEAARDGLLEAQAGKPSAEEGRRIKELLEALRRHPQPLPAEELQRLRAVEVLERLGTAESRRLLETLAGGGEARLTREAKAALTRTSGRTNPGR